MRLHVDIEIGGSTLGDGETGSECLADLLESAALAIRNRLLRDERDTVELRDPNNHVAGSAALIPDWKIGERVWVTASEGTLVNGTILNVDHPVDGFWPVICRSHTGEPMSWIYVDHRGFGRRGEPLLGRIR